MAEQVVRLIADVLGIPERLVSEDLAYGGLPEWDSFNHIELMLALETKYDRRIDEDLMVELTSVHAIEEWVAGRNE